jgi:hypothetical protein
MRDARPDARPIPPVTKQAPQPAPSPTGSEPAPTPLESLAARSTSLPSGTSLVADCIATTHPTLAGRVLCRINAPDGGSVERWIPLLTGLAVRDGDRVLLLQPANHAEPVVVGVLDGLQPRPERAVEVASARTLLADEVVRFVASSGEPIVEIGPGPLGPVVRLLASNVSVEAAGRVALTAGEVELRARAGSVRLDASDDVIVAGETIRLN